MNIEYELNEVLPKGISVLNVERPQYDENYVTLDVYGEKATLFFCRTTEVCKWIENLQIEKKLNDNLIATPYSLSETIQSYRDRWDKGESGYIPKFDGYKSRCSTILFTGGFNIIKCFYYGEDRSHIARASTDYIKQNEMVYLGQRCNDTNVVGLPNGYVKIAGAEGFGYTGKFGYSETPTSKPRVYLSEEDKFVYLAEGESTYKASCNLAVAYKFTCNWGRNGETVYSLERHNGSGLYKH